MPFYESVFITRQDLSNPQVEALADQLAGVITAPGGKITKRENWGLRNLTYRIKKNRKGTYIMFNIDAAADVVKEYERQMRLNEDIIRYLTVKVEELDSKPSAILAGDREPRGGRGRRADSGEDIDFEIPSLVDGDEEE